VYVAHEAKTEQTPKDPIGINDVRQAQSHVDWVRANRTNGLLTKILCLIESPRQSVDKDAVPHAKTLCYVAPAEMRTIGDEIATVLRQVRATASDLGSEAILEDVFQKLRDAKLRPEDIVERFSRQLVSKMPQV
jgi:hypothetical protein